MAKLLEYLVWRGDVPLGHDGFNELDAAVLARLSYLPFEHVPQERRQDGISLGELTALLAEFPGVADAVIMPEDLDLCRQISESDRFKEPVVRDYVCRWDSESETQFSALSLILPDGRCCIVYRGTDDTLIGWKEDLNMGLTFPVPAQTSAVEFLEETDRRLGCQSYILCGHSKGGNLAVYAGAFCKPELQEKVSMVYNFDGPGLDPAALETEGYKRIAPRILTFVPQFSVVGMLFGNARSYSPVRSDAFGILQHNLYSWEIQGRGFLYAEELDASSRMLDASLDAWMREMGADEREALVEAVYQILTQNNAQTLDQLGENRLENAALTLKTIRRLDPKTRANALRAMQLLMRSLKT